MLDLGTLNINVRADVDKAKSELEGLQDTTENVESTTSDVADSIGKSWGFGRVRWLGRTR